MRKGHYTLREKKEESFLGEMDNVLEMIAKPSILYQGDVSQKLRNGLRAKSLRQKRPICYMG